MVHWRLCTSPNAIITTEADYVTYSPPRFLIFQPFIPKAACVTSLRPRCFCCIRKAGRKPFLPASDCRKTRSTASKNGEKIEENNCMKSTMKNANGSIEEPLALLAFRQNQSYRTVVRLRIDFDEISLRFSQPLLFQKLQKKESYLTRKNIYIRQIK